MHEGWSLLACQVKLWLKMLDKTNGNSILFGDTALSQICIL